MENVYHTCLYDLVLYPAHQAGQAANVNQWKAKLFKLYSARLACGTIGMHTPDTFQEEWISLFHLIQKGTRREQQMISKGI